ncbi:MAG: DUF3892 domain-containing protein [Lachnospiraceae bacterium]|nr:DUF3892 domain-containing protein [Lachnospiraceae bacterium]
MIRLSKNFLRKRGIAMNLKVVEETSTGLNTKFVNQESGRSVSLEHAVQQIQKGNSNYSNYEVVTKSNGTTYIRSKPDGKIGNNIE